MTRAAGAPTRASVAKPTRSVATIAPEVWDEPAEEDDDDERPRERDAEHAQDDRRDERIDQRQCDGPTQVAADPIEAGPGAGAQRLRPPRIERTRQSCPRLVAVEEQEERQETAEDADGDEGRDRPEERGHVEVHPGQDRVRELVERLGEHGWQAKGRQLGAHVADARLDGGHDIVRVRADRDGQQDHRDHEDDQSDHAGDRRGEGRRHPARPESADGRGQRSGRDQGDEQRCGDRRETDRDRRDDQPERDADQDPPPDRGQPIEPGRDDESVLQQRRRDGADARLVPSSVPRRIPGRTLSRDAPPERMARTPLEYPDEACERAREPRGTAARSGEDGMRGITVIVLGAIVLLAAACSGTSGGGTGGTIEGITWNLTSYDVAGTSTPVPADVFVDARFGAGLVAGSSGCNTYSGTATVSGSTLKVGALAGTKMACQGPATDVESAYLGHLGKATSFTATADALTIYDPDGKASLVYAAGAANPLIGEWVVTGYNNGAGGVVSPAVGTTLTATFTADMVSGSSGCNTFTGSYTLDGINVDDRPARLDDDGV